MQREGLRAYGAFAACSIIWGSTFLAISIGNDSLPPMWAASLRLWLAGAILCVLLKLTRQSFPRGKALRTGAIYGLLTFGINFPLLYWGETVVPSGLAAILYATIPVTTMLLEKVLRIEHVSPVKLFSALVAIAGVAIIFWGEIGTGLQPWPIAAVFAAAVVSAFSGILLKQGPKQSAFSSNAAGTLVGAPVCLLMSFVLGEHRTLPSTTGQLVPLLYLTLAGSVGAFVLFAWLLNRWKTSTVTFIAVVIPVIAVLLGAIVRHERLTLQSGCGAVIVLLGVVIALQVERKPNPKAVPG